MASGGQRRPRGPGRLASPTRMPRYGEKGLTRGVEWNVRVPLERPWRGFGNLFRPADTCAGMTFACMGPVCSIAHPGGSLRGPVTWSCGKGGKRQRGTKTGGRPPEKHGPFPVGGAVRLTTQRPCGGRRWGGSRRFHHGGGQYSPSFCNGGCRHCAGAFSVRAPKGVRCGSTAALIWKSSANVVCFWEGRALGGWLRRQVEGNLACNPACMSRRTPLALACITGAYA